jgi:outer membrane biosynthesis protein TonB
MNRPLSRGAAVSLLLHLLLLAALLIGLPWLPPDEPPPAPDVEFTFVPGPVSKATKAPTPSPTPAPAVTPQTTLTAPADQPTKPLPPVPPPPAPPTTAAPSPSIPLPPPPIPVPPAPTPPSQTSQPNPTKNTAAESRELNATLEKLRKIEDQKAPPTHKANPLAGGAPKAGGAPLGDITAQLSAEQRGAIGDKVRECWTKDAGALDIDKMSVLLTVKTDDTGVVHLADVADADRARMSDPRFRAFAERAVRAVMDARCASLPLPRDKLGRVNELTFRFRP